LSPGDYELVAMDDLGNASTAPFTVARFDFSLDVNDSKSSCSAGVCQAFLMALTTTTLGIDRFEVWAGDVLVETVPADMTPGTQRTLIGPLPDNSNYTVEAVDIHNNRRRAAASLQAAQFGPANPMYFQTSFLPCGSGGACGGVVLSTLTLTLQATTDGSGLFGAGGQYMSGINDFRSTESFFGRLLGASATKILAGYAQSQRNAYRAPSDYEPSRVSVAGFVQPPASFQLGTLQLLYRTGDSPDLSDAGPFAPAWGAEIRMDSNFDVSFASAALLPTPFEFKRFGQLRADLSNALPEIFHSYSPNDPVNAPLGAGTAVRLPPGFLAIKTEPLLSFEGAAQGIVLPGSTPAAPPNTPAGSNVVVNLGPAVGVQFDSVSAPGTTSATPFSMSPPAGFQSLPEGVGIDINTSAGHSGPIRIDVGYNPLGLSDIQQSKIRLIHFPAGPGGVYVDVTDSLDLIRRQVHGTADSLSPFMVVYPNDAHLLRLEHEGASLDSPAADAGLLPLNTATAGVASFIESRSTSGYVLISNGYQVEPQGVTFTAPMSLKVPVSTAMIESGDVSGAVAAVFRFDPSTGEFFRISPLESSSRTTPLSASFNTAAGFYAVFAGTDTRPPESSLTVSEEAFIDEVGAVFVSTRHAIAIDASDEDPGRFSIGVATIAFAINPPDVSQQPTATFEDVFQLPPGQHAEKPGAVVRVLPGDECFRGLPGHSGS
jgi:hypothetical protein